MQLHGYYRSSATYRVRIALGLKGVTSSQISHHLRRGEQRLPGYLRLNPQGLVPALEVAGCVLTQSLAIIEWIEEMQPQPPLLPSEPFARARVRAFALAIACDIHPVQNLKILNRLRDLGVSSDAVTQWAADVNEEGLDACEGLLQAQQGPFCFGEQPTLADICLVPQLANARRFGIDVEQFPRLLAAEAAANDLAAFQAAAPDRQPDAE